MVNWTLLLKNSTSTSTLRPEFVLVDLREIFFFRFIVTGTNKNTLKMTS